MEAARIAWVVILIKTRQLILFDGAGFGIFAACAKRRQCHEWTQEGPQNGPQILDEFWGILMA